MRKTTILMLLCLLLAGCGAKTVPVETNAETAESPVQIANPWVSYDTLAEAEAAAGLDFPLPETVAGSYVAEVFQVMNVELLEVRYRDGDFPVTVRMQAGEGLDLSGVYGELENVQTVEVNGATVTGMIIDGGVVQLISKDGYSYSLYAPNDYWGDSNIEFLQYIYDAK